MILRKTEKKKSKRVLTCHLKGHNLPLSDLRLCLTSWIDKR